MGDISVENKLQLIAQLKNQYHKNQYDLLNREQILYGRTSSHRYDTEDDYLKNMDTIMPDAESQLFTHSRIRLILAVLLVTIVISCDSLGVSIFGWDTNTIFTAISQDISQEIENWVSANTSTIDLQAP